MPDHSDLGGRAAGVCAERRGPQQRLETLDGGGRVAPGVDCEGCPVQAGLQEDQIARRSRPPRPSFVRPLPAQTVPGQRPKPLWPLLGPHFLTSNLCPKSRSLRSHCAANSSPVSDQGLASWVLRELEPPPLFFPWLLTFLSSGHLTVSEIYPGGSLGKL